MLTFGTPAAFIHSLLGPFYFSITTTPIHRTKLIHTKLLLFSLSCEFFFSENPHQSCYRANGRNENRPGNDVNCTSGLPSGFQTVQSDIPEFTDQHDTDFLACPKFCFLLFFFWHIDQIPSTSTPSTSTASSLRIVLLSDIWTDSNLGRLLNFFPPLYSHFQNLSPLSIFPFRHRNQTSWDPPTSSTSSQRLLLLNYVTSWIYTL